MIEVSDGLARVEGAMTLACAKALLEEGSQLIANAAAGPRMAFDAFDLSAVIEVDSSALAIVFGWLREARRLGRNVRIVNLPESLSSLAEVYGVSDLLSVP